MSDHNLNEFDNGNGYNNGNRGGSQGGGGNGSSGGGSNPRRVNFLLLLVAALITLVLTSVFMRTLSNSNTEEISYSQFMQWVDDGRVEGQPNTVVESVHYGSDRIYIEKVAEEERQINPLLAYYTTAAKTTYYTAMVEDDTLPERLREAGVLVWGYIPDNSGIIVEILLYYVLPLVLFWVLLSFLFRRMNKGGGPMGVGKSNAKVYVQKETGITFKDVAGEDEAKESLQEVVDFLHNPGKYSKIGAKLPKGALLVGPPGTGKTLLAKAVAGEAGVPFFSLAGSDFIELYVGVGASRVRDLFKEATKNAPCIIFIDEIDAIGRSRDSKYGGGNEEREQTLNQLLSEMDGFDTSKGILILGATNRPEILDKALLRPGRFDRRIIVDKPDLKGRVEILKVHAKDVKMDETVDLDAIALATSGAVGADLANMINEAAINAVKDNREYVCQKDLFDAVEQVLVGKEKKDRIMSKEERKIVSYHEVGHALVSALQKNSEPVQKITIVPRTMGALGYVMHVPEEEKYLNTEAELRDMLVSLVAGRAAEEIVFETVTTGAANDIEKATGIARSMVTQYGMSKRFGLVGLSTVESKYLEGREVMNCSDKTAAEVDAEVVAILKESYEKAKELLSENRELMDKLAAFLIEKETITGKEFMEIFRREKGLPDPEETSEEKAEEEKPEKGSFVDATIKDEISAAESSGEGASKDEVSMEDISTEENSGTEVSREETFRTDAYTQPKNSSDIGVFSNHHLGDDR
ncbi:MAG: ATP-dependent zinc metalloprotease FtsH [Lachnospiraceae bacterium]|nr:ATP-dependent zinc metalloprotease FtsH [Lachnospiraceae bacterium]